MALQSGFPLIWCTPQWSASVQLMRDQASRGAAGRQDGRQAGRRAPARAQLQMDLLLIEVKFVVAFHAPLRVTGWVAILCCLPLGSHSQPVNHALKALEGSEDTP